MKTQLILLAGLLGLPTEGTVPALQTRCREALGTCKGQPNSRSGAQSPPMTRAGRPAPMARVPLSMPGLGVGAPLLGPSENSATSSSSADLSSQVMALHLMVQQLVAGQTQAQSVSSDSQTPANHNLPGLFEQQLKAQAKDVSNDFQSAEVHTLSEANSEENSDWSMTGAFNDPEKSLMR